MDTRSFNLQTPPSSVTLSPRRSSSSQSSTRSAPSTGRRKAYNLGISSPLKTPELDVIQSAESPSRLAAKYKNWTSQHLAAHIKSSLAFRQIEDYAFTASSVNEAAGWVIQERVTGRSFYELAEEDIEELNIPEDWRSVLLYFWNDMHNFTPSGKRTTTNTFQRTVSSSRTKLPWGKESTPSPKRVDESGLTIAVPLSPPIMLKSETPSPIERQIEALPTPTVTPPSSPFANETSTSEKSIPLTRKSRTSRATSVSMSEVSDTSSFELEASVRPATTTQSEHGILGSTPGENFFSAKEEETEYTETNVGDETIHASLSHVHQPKRKRSSSIGIELVRRIFSAPTLSRTSSTVSYGDVSHDPTDSPAFSRPASPNIFSVGGPSGNHLGTPTSLVNRFVLSRQQSTDSCFTEEATERFKVLEDLLATSINQTVNMTQKMDALEERLIKLEKDLDTRDADQTKHVPEISHRALTTYAMAVGAGVMFAALHLARH